MVDTLTKLARLAGLTGLFLARSQPHPLSRYKRIHTIQRCPEDCLGEDGHANVDLGGVVEPEAVVKVRDGLELLLGQLKVGRVQVLRESVHVVGFLLAKKYKQSQSQSR